MGKSVPARDLNPPRGRSSRPPSADRRWAHAWLTCPDPLVQVLQRAIPRSRTCHRRLQGKPKSRLVLAVGGDMYQLCIASLQHWRIAWTSGLHHVRYAGAPRTAAHDAAMSPPNYAREILSLALPPVRVQWTNTKKIRQGRNTDPAEFSWCRAGVSASIEDCDGKGRATPFKVPSTRERTRVVTRAHLLDKCCEIGRAHV